MDFEMALGKVQPSVSAQQRKRYQALRSKFAGLPVSGGRKMKDKVEGLVDGVGEGIEGMIREGSGKDEGEDADISIGK
jgi:hypothetical protein